ncbi:LysR family transcriptional regulator [Gluconobacter roseus]|uniref:LysR family transcriptional regulator n=1 Tax=Gluconobacter roseus NBRC 3990 TaxID=1307950 RepID=A0A4Y3M2N8_9PROT|nr:LysR family transcriptional regulator [Gluconobacter roseus]KXV44277.1 transcriptional regulator [Gluconobacter roseus]GBR44479.1 LysR family transcriptional regulator [Gluconobacter roseus NBRC 3990]GEB02637.1 LysR family transcriptional regulator [Gluconobacter roseus NBRC 3990]GLP93096.1 LysR family transcriptional regulator [Gluconobacter roseus NBRC 3990]
MRHDETGDLRFFAHLVASGSLTVCARNLQTSPATVSRRLARLESRLGSLLVVRNTRHFGLSENGRIYHERAVEILALVDSLEEEISSNTNIPRGTLGIGAPVELGRRLIAPFLATFSATHPDLLVNLALASEGFYDTSDSLDVVLRLGLPDSPDAVVTRLASTVRVLCASPEYLARHPPLVTPQDLATHHCLCLRRNKTMALLDRWVIGNDLQTEIITVEPRLSSTNAEIIHDWALSGEGIAYKLLCDVKHDLEQGRLMRIFPDLQGEKIDLHAVLPNRKYTQASVRAFLHSLKSHLRVAGFF